MIRKVAMTNGMTALVDEEDYEKVMGFNWYLKNKRYAAAGDKTLFMHRLLLPECPPWPLGEIDHINGNGLDNRRSNLRICTKAQNQWNARRRTDNTTGYKGVSKHGNRFKAYIFADGKQIHLGMFATPEEAAEQYKIASRKYYGEYANHG